MDSNTLDPKTVVPLFVVDGSGDVWVECFPLDGYEAWDDLARDRLAVGDCVRVGCKMTDDGSVTFYQYRGAQLTRATVRYDPEAQ